MEELEKLLYIHRHIGGMHHRIIEVLARDIYQNPRHYGFRQIDEIGDAFSLYWFRILAMIDRYRPAGKSFAIYAQKTFRCFANTIRREQAKEWDKKMAFLDNSVYYSETCENEPEYNLMRNCRSREILSQRSSSKAYRRRLEYLVLKCSPILEAREAVDMAESLATVLPDIEAKMSVAGRQSIVGLRRFYSYRRSRNLTWMRLKVLERRISRSTDSYEKSCLNARAASCREAYLRYIANINSIRKSLSNRQVGEILGVPKSTIDSGMSRLYKQFDVEPSWKKKTD